MMVNRATKKTQALLLYPLLLRDELLKLMNELFKIKSFYGMKLATENMCSET